MSEVLYVRRCWMDPDTKARRGKKGTLNDASTNLLHSRADLQ